MTGQLRNFSLFRIAYVRVPQNVHSITHFRRDYNELCHRFAVTCFTVLYCSR